MQTIKFRYEAEQHFDLPIEAVIAIFQDPVALATCTPHVTRYAQLEDASVAYTLQTQRDLGLEFTPTYRLHYAWETARTLTWRTRDDPGGNVEVEARVQFIAPTPTTARVIVDERIAFTLPVTFITAKIVQVMAKRESLRDMQTLLQAVNATALARREPEAVA